MKCPVTPVTCRCRFATQDYPAERRRTDDLRQGFSERTGGASLAELPPGDHADAAVPPCLGLQYEFTHGRPRLCHAKAVQVECSGRRDSAPPKLLPRRPIDPVVRPLRNSGPLAASR